MHRCWRSLARALDNAKVAAFVVADLLGGARPSPRPIRGQGSALASWRSSQRSLYHALFGFASEWRIMGMKILLFAVPTRRFWQGARAASLQQNIFHDCWPMVLQANLLGMWAFARQS